VLGHGGGFPTFEKEKIMVAAAPGRFFQEFVFYHEANPRIYELFVHYAKQARDAGRASYSGYTIIHRIRWHMSIDVKRQDEFKINDHHTSFYCRMVMFDHPEFEGFFSLRDQRDEGFLLDWLENKQGDLDL
jgi:hypothetical protein